MRLYRFARDAVSSSVLMILLSTSLQAARPGARTVTVKVRGKPQSIQIYEPAPGTAKRSLQVLVTSGDLGWLGISGDLPGHLQDQGYRVIGFDARTYVAAFTGKGGAGLEADKIPGDYRTVMDSVRDNRYPRDYVSVGVSEGAGLAVLAMGQPDADSHCRGIVALGLPVMTALGWRWTDFTSWITKKEPNEPEVATEGYLVHLKVPLVMIHSMHDEYDNIDKVRALFDKAPEPKRFFAVDASNHRFSNRIPQVLSITDDSLVWFASLDSNPGEPREHGDKYE